MGAGGMIIDGAGVGVGIGVGYGAGAGLAQATGTRISITSINPTITRFIKSASCVSILFQYTITLKRRKGY
jgi:hypothetical protein